MKADHPFVFEFPLRQSSDGFITNQRRTRKTLEWTGFLNAVLQTRIKAIGPRADYHWVLNLSANRAPTQADVIWGPEFYTIDGSKAQDEEFSACGEPHIARIPHEEYYATAVYRWGEFVVPDNFDDMINAFTHLNSEDRFRFLRACQWVYVAYAHWVTHASSFYIALVAAIESLLPAAPLRKSVQRADEARVPALRNCFKISSRRTPKAKLHQVENRCMLCVASLHMAEVCCSSMRVVGHFHSIPRRCRNVKSGQNCITWLERC